MKRLKSYEIDGMIRLGILFITGILGYCGYLLLYRMVGGNYGTIPCILVMALLAGISAGLLLRRNFTEGVGVFMIFASSMALKLDYIFYTSCYMRQQDTLIFDYPMGHLGYIGYLYYNRHLPDFDPRSAWSFSHPPLHHAISAVWVRICTKLGIELDMAIENIQLLTLFYSFAILLFLYMILKELNIKGLIMHAILLIVAFHPAFILMSGSVNNDELAVMFMVGSILYTIRWYKDSSYKNTLILAVMIGCAMMSKVSAGFVAPAVAAVFLIKLIQERVNWKKYMVKFAAFGMLVFPLGLWAPLRNKLLFGVPLNYAEKLKMDDLQYIGNIPMVQRLTDFSSYQFDNLNIQFAEAGTYREFNVFISLLKTAIFGQFDFYLASPMIKTAGTVLFWMNVLLVFAGIAAMTGCFVKNRKHLWIEKMFLMILTITFMFSYLTFCMGYPHICTMHVRYIIPVLFAGLLYLAIFMQEWKDAKKETAGGTFGRLPERILMGMAVIWALLSVVMFLVLGTI